jgi:hypothetical protein
MANEIKDAKDGLGTRLATISGLRVIDYPPDSQNEFPAALIRLESRDMDVALGGSSFEGTMLVRVYISMAKPQDAMDELDLYMDPLGAKSIEAAIDGDNTWDSKVDDGRLSRIDNVRIDEGSDSGRYAKADFHVQFIKQVLT